MDAGPSTHPTAETLRAYGLAKLDEPAAETVNRHLADCPDCQRKVTEMTASGSAIAGGLATEATSVDAAVLGPVSSPCMSSTGHVESTSDAGGNGEDASLPPGTRVGYFGDYELLKVLGEGGMGIVYKARQLSLNRLVALKMIKASRFPSPDEVRRFQNEAEAVARLDHPNIVPIFEVGRFNDQHYFSMKLIAGESLEKRLKEYVAHPRLAAELMVATTEAILHAHQRGILHRDLKPANILVDGHGQPHVSDFGLAKRIDGDSELTRSGAIVGTPAYMAPEQASGTRGTITTSTDVYGLGAILYALLTGRAPFGGTSVLDVLEQVRKHPPDPPKKLNPLVSRDLQVIVFKCLDKDPGRRYTSTQSLADDLGRYLAGEAILARPVTTFERVVKWARRKPAIAAMLGLLSLVTALGLGGVLWQWNVAVLARRDAERERERAKGQTVLAEQRLYDVRMNLLQRYWEAANGELLNQGLVEQLPIHQRGIDRRGFEWYYWHRKISSSYSSLKGHSDLVRTIAYSPKGERLVSASQDGSAKLWDTSTGREILSFDTHYDEFSVVAFSPNGKWIASDATDLSVLVWDAETGKVTQRLRGHDKEVWSVAISPDGKRIASGGDDRTVKIWDAVSGRETLTLQGHTDRVISVVFSPDGKRIASAAEDGEVKVWNAETGQEALAFKGGSVVTISPDGKHLASVGLDGTVRVRDAGTGEETSILNGHTKSARDVAWKPSVAFSPDGSRLASATLEGQVKLWDYRTASEIFTRTSYDGFVGNIAFSPDGKWLACGAEGIVKLWNATASDETLTFKGHSAPVHSVAFSPDGKRIASGDDGGAVKIWDAITGRETLTLKGHTDTVSCVSFSPDGKRIASADGGGKMRVWNAGTGQEAFSLDGGSSVMFSPDGKHIAGEDPHGGVRLWDGGTGEEALVLSAPDEGLIDVAFRPNHKQFASASMDGTVKLRDARTGEQIVLLAAQQEMTTSKLVFSADGTRLASLVSDGTVKLSDPDTGHELLSLKGHAGFGLCLAISPDGTRIASASRDRTVKIWDTVTGHETLTLKGHTAAVNDVAFSPGGNLLASASSDGTLKVWDARELPTGRLSAEPLGSGN